MEEEVKSKIPKYYLIVLSLIVGVILIELILRIYYWAGENFQLNLTPQRPTLRFYDNQIFGSALTPNQKGWFVPQSKEYFSLVEVNSHGWPDIEHDFKKPDGVFRILFLGDSFVENLQFSLNERFFRKFEREINQKISDKKIEVIALGRGNTGTAQQYLILKKYALKYQPDLVIQMFLTANDVKNNLPALMNDPYLPYFQLDQAGNLKEIPHQRRDQKKFYKEKELIKNLRFIELLLQVRQNFLEKKKNTSLDYPIDYHIYDRSYSIDFSKAWDITKKLILESKKEVEQSGAKYVLVTLTNNEQVNKDVLDGLFKTYPKMKDANLDLEKPDQQIQDLCQDQNLDCLFMLPFFKDYIQKNPTARTHNFYEGHWNKIGTNLAAEFLLNEVPKFIEEKN